MKLILDLEANGFDVKVIHCIVIKDVSTNIVYRYNPDNLEDALKILKQATLLIGHNIQGYDLPALDKIFNFKYEGEVFDTLLASRLIWTNRADADWKYKDVPPKLVGKHSLASWGYRLGLRKGDFAEQEGAFEIYTPEMLDYCANDVEVTHKLYNTILKQNYSSAALELEHKFAYWIRQQENYGCKFDKTSAQKLYEILIRRRLELEQRLNVVFPKWKKFIGTFRPKRDNKTKGYKKGVSIKRYKTETFNPNSRDHIADRLQSLRNWKPKNFTLNNTKI